MIRTATRALPVWVRFRSGRMTQSVTLGHTAGFGSASLLLLDLG